MKTRYSCNSLVLELTMEKAMAPHSSTLAWKIPWAEEPGRLQSMGSSRDGHNWATSLSLFTFMHWRRKWQPTPVFLPGESQGQGSLVGCHLWGFRVGHDWSDLAELTKSNVLDVSAGWVTVFCSWYREVEEMTLRKQPGKNWIGAWMQIFWCPLTLFPGPLRLCKHEVRDFRKL